jgi:phosphatidylethanolamine-binding protein (PEBP) family uncharacterized protein
MKKWQLLGFGTIMAGLVTTGCGSSDSTVWKITSPAFADGAALPASATCNGNPFGTGSSPEFDWTDGPSGTKSYAIVFKDLTIYAANDPTTIDHAYHWAIWDIPASIHKLPAALGSSEFLSDVGNARQWSSVNPFGYLGACPNPVPGTGATPGTDNYSFTLYAINVPILAYPPDPTSGDNYVHPLDDFLKTPGNNIGTTELHATSNAAASAFTPPNPPPSPSTRP